jgi:hypothetical protein
MKTYEELDRVYFDYLWYKLIGNAKRAVERARWRQELRDSGWTERRFLAELKRRYPPLKAGKLCRTQIIVTS